MPFKKGNNKWNGSAIARSYKKSNIPMFLDWSWRVSLTNRAALLQFELLNDTTYESRLTRLLSPKYSKPNIE